MKSSLWKVFGLCLLLSFSVINTVVGEEARGKVSEVSATGLTATFSQTGRVQVGNEATIALWLEGVGAIPIRGTWQVKSVSGTRAVLVPSATDNAQPLVGQDVTIADTRHRVRVSAPAPTPAPLQSGDGWGKSAPSVRNTPRPTSGVSSRDNVRYIQQRLVALGYDAGVADGVMGPRTRNAIRSYQRDQGVMADGRPSADLRRLLASVPGKRITLLGKDAPMAQQSSLPRQDDRPTAEIIKEAKDYYFGRNGKPLDYERSLALNMICAARGDPGAIYSVGVAYAFGNGIEKDVVMARGFFEQAAAKGNVRAAFNLATIYHNGMGVKKDPGKAMGYMRQAAKGSDPETYHGMGTFYRLGVGVEASREMAIHWYLKGARLGDKKCQEQLKKMGVVW